MKTEEITLTPMESSRGIQFQNLGGYTLSIGFGGGHYCDNYSKRYDAMPEATATMEVAILDGDSTFVVLTDDVAAYVPVSVLGSLINAVTANDWELVKKLCTQ
jgi:hypothetical protein|tara:strand:+ start:131 stop:439 length:309 start_codon:yes stop_codon:yes gene_type:complete